MLPKVRCLVCGSRSIIAFGPVNDAIVNAGIHFRIEVRELVSGAARGVDRNGELWAERRNIQVRRFPANWALYGRAAGMRRNEQMLDYVQADPEGGLVVVVWDGFSSGTRHVLTETLKRKIPTYLYLYRGQHVLQGSWPDATLLSGRLPFGQTISK